MNFDLAGQVVIITGSSRGIGRAMALAFADAGAKVVVASRKQEGVDAVAAEIGSHGGTAMAVAAHVGQEEAVSALVERVVEVFKAHNVGYFFYIGGNDSMDTAHKVANLAHERGLDLVATRSSPRS